MLIYIEWCFSRGNRLAKAHLMRKTNLFQAWHVLKQPSVWLWLKQSSILRSYNKRAFYPFIFTKYPPASCLCNPSKHMPGAATFVPSWGYSPGGVAICICHLHWWKGREIAWNYQLLALVCLLCLSIFLRILCACYPWCSIVFLMKALVDKSSQ